MKTEAVIRKVGNEYCVFSKSGKNLGCSSTKKGAEKRLQEIEYWKNQKAKEMFELWKNKTTDGIS